MSQIYSSCLNLSEIRNWRAAINIMIVFKSVTHNEDATSDLVGRVILSLRVVEVRSELSP